MKFKPPNLKKQDLDEEILIFEAEAAFKQLRKKANTASKLEAIYRVFDDIFEGGE